MRETISGDPGQYVRRSGFWLFRDREDAGRQLAAHLVGYRDSDPIVLALPRGGVPVGYQIAQALDAPLDVFPVRKLGVPGHREFGMGAVAPGGIQVLDAAAMHAIGITREQMAPVIAEETAELDRRLRRFRGDQPFPDLHDRTVILVDDGLATGVTARAAVQAIRQLAPKQLVLAVPICSPEAAETLQGEVDDLICLARPRDFYAVGLWYGDFRQTSDDEVLELLTRARKVADIPTGTP